jgi:hypothetical protein
MRSTSHREVMSIQFQVDNSNELEKTFQRELDTFKGWFESGLVIQDAVCLLYSTHVEYVSDIPTECSSLHSRLQQSHGGTISTPLPHDPYIRPHSERRQPGPRRLRYNLGFEEVRVADN